MPSAPDLVTRGRADAHGAPGVELRFVRRGDRTVLQPNMTLHFMPALWLDDGGLELSETILITPTGVECLCKTPRKLVVKS